MKKLPRHVISLSLALAATAGLAKADKVVFTNGDTVTGTITCADGGKIVFESPTMGTLNIDMKDVQTFSTDEPVHLVMNDGTVINEKVTTGAAGQVDIAPGGNLQPQPVNLANVTKINPPPEHWTGSITLNGQLTRGNTSSNEIGFNADALRQSDIDRITAHAEYLYGQQKVNGVDSTTANDWIVGGKYDMFITKQWYAYADARLEHDEVQNLTLRFTPGVGIGYQWVQQPDFNFDTEAGLSWVYEDYSTLPSPRENVSARLAYHLDRAFDGGKIKIFNDVQYFPSVQNFNNYLLLTDAGVRFALTKTMYSEIKAEVDYDSEPGPGSKRTDTKILVGLGWTF